MSDPRITDNDRGEISATVAGKEVRGWSYSDDAERRLKMRMAHEFAEGWFQAVQAAPQQAIIVDAMQRLNESGAGEMGLVETIHATYDILRRATAAG
jgi:hypothetical protein